MIFDQVFLRAINLEPLTLEEGVSIYEQVPTSELMVIASQIRQIVHVHHRHESERIFATVEMILQKKERKRREKIISLMKLFKQLLMITV